MESRRYSRIHQADHRYFHWCFMHCYGNRKLVLLINGNTDTTTLFLRNHQLLAICKHFSPWKKQNKTVCLKLNRHFSCLIVKGVSFAHDEVLLSYSTTCSTRASSSHLLFSIANAASVKDSQKTPTNTANGDQYASLLFLKDLADVTWLCDEGQGKEDEELISGQQK